VNIREEKKRSIYSTVVGRWNFENWKASGKMKIWVWWNSQGNMNWSSYRCWLRISNWACFVLRVGEVRLKPLLVFKCNGNNFISLFQFFNCD